MADFAFFIKGAFFYFHAMFFGGYIVNEPVDIGHSGVILSQPFRTSLVRGDLDLAFSFSTEKTPRDDLLKLLGRSSRWPSGELVDPGVVLPVLIKVYDVEDSSEKSEGGLFLEVKANAAGVSYFSSDDVGRRIAQIKLGRGHRYIVEVTLLEDRPEFKGVEVRFQAWSDPRRVPN